MQLISVKLPVNVADYIKLINLKTISSRLNLLTSDWHPFNDEIVIVDGSRPNIIFFVVEKMLCSLRLLPTFSEIEMHVKRSESQLGATGRS